MHRRRRRAELHTFREQFCADLASKMSEAMRPDPARPISIRRAAVLACWICLSLVGAYNLGSLFWGPALVVRSVQLGMDFGYSWSVACWLFAALHHTVLTVTMWGLYQSRFAHRFAPHHIQGLATSGRWRFLRSACRRTTLERTWGKTTPRPAATCLCHPCRRASPRASSRNPKPGCSLRPAKTRPPRTHLARAALLAKPYTAHPRLPSGRR
jgi:hypothetical protein